MHNNYYFLKQVSHALENILKGAVLSECFSQAKEELVLRFETEKGSFYIKASLLPAISCLSYIREFHRARKNSADLFTNVIGFRVTRVRQFRNERSFALCLSHDHALVFKMHGTRANVLLFHQQDVIDLFKNSIEADRAIKLDSLDREIDWSLDHFTHHQQYLSSVYFTFGKIVWQYLKSAGFDAQSLEQKWDTIQQLLMRLENPVFYITEINDLPALSLLPVGTIRKQENDPIAASNDFFYSFTQAYAFRAERSSALSVLKSRLQASRNFIKTTQEKLAGLQQSNNYKIWADLVMANLHAIGPGDERITLPNFYNENIPVEIKLKKGIPPQKNAETFYRKAKNQAKEIEHLQEVLRSKENEVTDLAEKIRVTETAEDLKDIRKITTGFQKPDDKKQAASLPYHEFIVNHFKIWVGKNAQHNDTLTLKFAYKEDLWLHAKDVAGSHVIIKYQSGKSFPKDVIERAAQLAAYNSKRKNETLCPVIVTPRKFVRKRKGDPAGAVVVEREEVLMVEPKL